MINTNLHAISHRFQVTADYWSNLCLCYISWYLSLTHSFGVNP